MCIFVCFVWNVLLWHVHVRTGISQTDKQTQSVRGGQEDFGSFLQAWIQPNATATVAQELKRLVH